MPHLDQLRNAYETARRDLLAERTAAGHWVGELSSSALSTATAVSALSLVARHDDDQERRENCRKLARRGIEYLAGCQEARCQSADGGCGDTDKNSPKIATTMLVRAAFTLADAAEEHADLLRRAEQYIDRADGLAGLRRRYGRDKTFAVPILTNAALAGQVPWREVAPLPFELACFPYPLLRFLRLPVVSYAVPALVAIGQARYFHRKPRNPIAWLVRRSAIGRSLETLRRMQPDSGGFLEATPLTSFVVMSLASIGRVDHPVVRRGLAFLEASVRDDGSWPIDTNLATWNTTLAINGLAAHGADNTGNQDRTEDVSAGCLDWLLSCQYRQLHPFTHAAPGGWGWSDLSGAVPDVDDTAGALLALRTIYDDAPEAGDRKRSIEESASAGVAWLLSLQNTDGGWPTFCRGWGKLPFDRSGADLTAHALRALHAWRELANVEKAAVEKVTARGFGYLAKRQKTDGSWAPLWFGNQYHPAEENPVYGTGRVLLAYRDLGRLATEPARRGLAWLAANQGPDGGWGGPEAGESDTPAAETASVEETAVAVEALLSGSDDERLQTAAQKGLRWLISAVEQGHHRRTAPIGFYFAKLWYHERLYPLTFTVSALGRALRQ